MTLADWFVLGFLVACGGILWLLWKGLNRADDE